MSNNWREALEGSLKSSGTTQTISRPISSESSNSSRKNNSSYIKENNNKNVSKSQVRKIPKQDDEARRILGQANVLYAESQYEESQKACFEVIRRYPQVTDSYRILLNIAQDRNDDRYELEIRKFIYGIEKNNDPDDLKDICLLAARLGETETAIDYLIKARDNDNQPVGTPGRFDYNALLSQLHMEQGKYDQAIKDIEPEENSLKTALQHPTSLLLSSTNKDTENNIISIEQQNISIWISHIYGKFKGDKTKAAEIAGRLYDKTNKGRTMTADNLYHYAFTLYDIGQYNMTKVKLEKFLGIKISKNFDSLKQSALYPIVDVENRVLLTDDVRIYQMMTLLTLSILKIEAKNENFADKSGGTSQRTQQRILKRKQELKGLGLPDLQTANKTNYDIAGKLSKMDATCNLDFDCASESCENETESDQIKFNSNDLIGADEQTFAYSDITELLIGTLLKPILTYQSIDTLVKINCQLEIICCLMQYPTKHFTKTKLRDLLNCIIFVVDPTSAKKLKLKVSNAKPIASEPELIFGPFFYRNIVARSHELIGDNYMSEAETDEKRFLTKAMNHFEIAAEQYHLINQETQDPKYGKKMKMSVINGDTDRPDIVSENDNDSEDNEDNEDSISLTSKNINNPRKRKPTIQITTKSKADFKKASIVALKSIEIATILEKFDKAFEMTKRFIFNDFALTQNDPNIPLKNRIPKDVFICGVLNLLRLDFSGKDKDKIKENSARKLENQRLINDGLALWLYAAFRDSMHAFDYKIEKTKNFNNLDQGSEDRLRYHLIEVKKSHLAEQKKNNQNLVQIFFSENILEAYDFVGSDDENQESNLANKLLNNNSNDNSNSSDVVNKQIDILKILSFGIDYFFNNTASTTLKNQTDTTEDLTIRFHDIYYLIMSLKNSKQVTDDQYKQTQLRIYSRPIIISAITCLLSHENLGKTTTNVNCLEYKQINNLRDIMYYVLREWAKDDEKFSMPSIQLDSNNLELIEDIQATIDKNVSVNSVSGLQSGVQMKRNHPINGKSRIWPLLNHCLNFRDKDCRREKGSSDDRANSKRFLERIKVSMEKSTNYWVGWGFYGVMNYDDKMK